MSKTDEGIKIIINDLENNWKQKDNENLIRYLLKIVKNRIKIEALVKELNKHITSIDTFVADRILEQDPEYSIVVDGIKFHPEIKESYSLDKEILGVDKPKWDCEKFFKFLEEQGENGVIEVKKSVHHKTRNKVLDTLREQNIDLPEWIIISFFKHMKYSESAVKKSVS
jgi:hypothetical protein